MAEQQQKGRQRTYPLLAQNATFTEPEPVPDEPGKFKITATCLVLYGNRPAQDATFRYMVNGAPCGDWQQVEPDGRAVADLFAAGKSAHIAVHVTTRRTDIAPQSIIVSLKTIPLPQLKRKLELIGKFPFGEKIQIYLRRVGKDGKAEDGRIAFFDFDREKWTMFTQLFESADDAVRVTRPILAQARRVEFFLPDDQEVKVGVEIPGLKPEPTAKDKPSLLEAIAKGVKGFQRGQRAYKRHGNILGALSSLAKEEDK